MAFLSEYDLQLFNDGSFFRAYEKMGAHVINSAHGKKTFFAVWAPNAKGVSVIGDFNSWNPSSSPLVPSKRSGVWVGEIGKDLTGQLYKYHVVSQHNDYAVDKCDPYAFYAEAPPRTASKVWDLSYAWNDEEWMRKREKKNALSAPLSIYEVHLGSWMRVPEEGNRYLTYRELAARLADYVVYMGFTHVELMPVMEHPFYGSWGYQVTGYFSPTSRYGTPQDFMFLIDHLHKKGIGVILDWVPSHFPCDEHGLAYFDGTNLYEHSDPRQGYHPDWKSSIFNFGRNEVRSFLLSSAFFWLDKYHVDGLRVDGVASMIYLDYSRRPGEWVPNEHGGNENYAATSFLRLFNKEVYLNYPDVQTFAEESTSWPMVSRPTDAGGLGFGYKWDMGWMHDMLEYMGKDPLYRKYHHQNLTFRMLYAHSENFVLSLSHDEVVHGKGSLFGKMPGDAWQKLANLRALFGAMTGMPGKKLLFMGDEFGQPSEWNHDASLDWHLLSEPPHHDLNLWIKDLNHMYRNEPALHELDCDPSGFEWIDCGDAAASVVNFIRRGKNTKDVFLVVCNFTPQPRSGYRIGVPLEGEWTEVLNSDAPSYGGSGMGNMGWKRADSIPFHGRPYSLELTLPPLSAVFFKKQGSQKPS